jgi:hypothetical protein
MKFLTNLLLSSVFVLYFGSSAQAALADITRIFHQTPQLNQFEICQGGGCAEVSATSLTELEWKAVAKIFNSPAKNAEDERKKIAQAIGVLEGLVGRKVGTSTDRAGTFDNAGYPGQLDCNDEAINTTTYMRLLKQNGFIRFHEIEDTRTRDFFFTGWPHTTAVIHEIKTGDRYAVDSWFYDNGAPATIVPFSQWKSGYKPDDSPIGKPRTAKVSNPQK